MTEKAKARILIVDDDPSSIQLIAGALQPDYACTFALSGEDALAAVHDATLPDVILLDLSMPDMDGFEVCQHLKAGPRTRGIPVIVITAAHDPESEVGALEAGAADFLHKPVVPRVARLRVGTQVLLRQREQSLEALNAELEQRVIDRTRDLREALQRAEAANRAKTTFLANISHEIRTPLNGILGMAGLLRSKETDPDKRRRLDHIHTAGQNLFQVLSNVLDIARIEGGEVQLDARDFTPADLRSRLEPVARDSAARNLPLSMNLDALPARLRGDLDLLAQVLGRLLDNAVKFTEQGSIRLDARRLAETEHRVQLAFEVADTGCGIDPEAWERIFQPFELADNSATRKSGGSGLGLAIARQLAALMDGTVRVAASSPAGSTVVAEVWLEKGL